MRRTSQSGQTVGTPEPTPIGQAPSSHGCIRHADEVAKQIYDNLVDGATVIVKQG